VHQLVGEVRSRQSEGRALDCMCDCLRSTRTLYACCKREGAFQVVALYALHCVVSVGEGFATLNCLSLVASRPTLLTMALLEIGMSLEWIGYKRCWQLS
jgi:hypothetical protein